LHKQKTNRSQNLQIGDRLFVQNRDEGTERHHKKSSQKKEERDAAKGKLRKKKRAPIGGRKGESGCEDREGKTFRRKNTPGAEEEKDPLLAKVNRGSPSTGEGWGCCVQREIAEEKLRPSDIISANRKWGGGKRAPCKIFPGNFFPLKKKKVDPLEENNRADSKSHPRKKKRFFWNLTKGHTIRNERGNGRSRCKKKSALEL